VRKKFMIVRRVTALFAIAVLGFFGAIICAQEGSQKAEGEDRPEHTRFDARDRASVGEWYKENRDHLPHGFRQEDQLNPKLESRLRIGEVLDPVLQAKTQPVEADLLQRLPPPPREDRYVALDGHLLLVNEKTWKVSDVLHFELDFGRPW
jgi:hypothetical protein